ncbi:hypothetical protein GOBAR_AA07491 [Gossypium barbadense]|uniref:Uncharacterized protein n=1 Tax=Gossypium barbadense TaxID=3634 RepID=A0A2P5YC85_GOSBA|nr:hypothetical protein GOBAR_AA07491 [Gossypium barbadense]
MSSSRGKKTVVPASKKRKGASSSAGPTAKIRHPLLQFPRRPQEELFQILRPRPLIMGCCIDWATVEQVQMGDAIRALLTTDPWKMFFGIIESTYLELTMELCSTFHLQTEGERALASSTPTTSTSYGACRKAPDGVASEGGHLHWPPRDSTARHFGLLNIAAQESSFTLIDQMSPLGISSMLSMRMIERHRGTYPPHYRLTQSTKEEAYKDIPDDVPP